MAKRSLVEVAAGLGVLAAAAGFLAYAGANTGYTSAGGLRLSAQFDNVGSLVPGSEVKIGGVPVGRVLETMIDAKSFQALVRFTVRPDLKLPTDSSATISTGGLMGSAFLSVSPGGAEGDLADGGRITITQSASNLEDLLGKFIFNVGNLADATQRSLKENAGKQP